MDKLLINLLQIKCKVGEIQETNKELFARQQAMDFLFLQVVSTQRPGHADLVDVELYVNGQQFPGDFTIDVRSLVASLSQSGELDIFTCGYGEPMCARIYDNCIVTIGETFVEWDVPTPTHQAKDTVKNNIHIANTDLPGF